MTQDKLNGSVETLAYAFRDVMIEAVSPLYEKIDGLGRRMDKMEGRMDTLEQSIATTNQNMAAQFAAQSRYISEEIDKKLTRLGK